MDMYFLHFAVEFKALYTFTEMIGPFRSKFSSFVVYSLCPWDISICVTSKNVIVNNVVVYSVVIHVGYTHAVTQAVTNVVTHVVLVPPRSHIQIAYFGYVAVYK